MKYIGSILIAVTPPGLTILGLHEFAHTRWAPPTPWLTWFGHLPLPPDPLDSRTAILAGACALLALVGGLLLAASAKKNRRNKEGQL